ncbi:hypothetical protein BpHYR1_031212 [Brachionus plicatilis]|uniref:Uncharacterized protein n=1 Tax=Brachionus plicatilis TaxID=10195 RepID=A0A3M7Q9T7_BRAPC|nr:hypothetical protein BpHYR1_031212 [Brachionus plicatilis]
MFFKIQSKNYILDPIFVIQLCFTRFVLRKGFLPLFKKIKRYGWFQNTLLLLLCSTLRLDFICRIVGRWLVRDANVEHRSCPVDREDEPSIIIKVTSYSSEVPSPWVGKE